MLAVPAAVPAALPAPAGTVVGGLPFPGMKSARAESKLKPPPKPDCCCWFAIRRLISVSKRASRSPCSRTFSNCSRVAIVSSKRSQSLNVFLSSLLVSHATISCAATYASVLVLREMPEVASAILCTGDFVVFAGGALRSSSLARSSTIFSRQSIADHSADSSRDALSLPITKALRNSNSCAPTFFHISQASADPLISTGTSESRSV